MEVENMSRKTASTKEEEEDDVPLPGFRFHPTDEELVGFYLRRKVEKRPVTIELIKQADIYKYDPWDLPKSSSVEDQKEWYFFCKRGRKYKNSIRPNRVTGSGFWKATGIDRPIYKGRDCIGLKKSLVYYRGSAGKGTKTEWMMHEFRLPPPAPRTARTTNTQTDATTIAQEAEVWTLCRILKRNVSYRKSEPWRNNIQVDAKKSTNNTTCSVEGCDQNNAQSRYISFQHNERKPFSTQEYEQQNSDKSANRAQFEAGYLMSSSPSALISQTPSTSDHHASSSLSCLIDHSTATDINELLRNADWEDLQAFLLGRAAASTANYTNPFYF